MKNCKLDGSVLVYEDSDAEVVGVDDEIVEEGWVVGDGSGLKANQDNIAAAAAAMPDDQVIVFADENGQDGENALEKGCRALEKLEWSYDNIPFFFNRVETRMAMHGVKKQYTKPADFLMPPLQNLHHVSKIQI